MDTQIAFPAMVKEYRLANSLTMEQLAEKLGKTKSTISKWESGSRSPKIYEIEEIANFFGVQPATMMFGTTATPTPAPAIGSQEPTDELTKQILETVGDLSPNGKKSVLSYASELLEREQDDVALAEQPLFTVYYTSAAKAGPTGFSYDDYDNDKYVYTDEEPPRYDIATMVDGWSMAPDYDDGDILYLRDYGTSHYNGQECVVVVDDKNYFKKVYTTDEGLLLVSINEDKDEFPNFTIPFPPNEDTHIKIFEVVGSFTPVEG